MNLKVWLLLALFLLGGVALDAQNADNKWGVGASLGIREYNGDFTNQFYSFKQNFGGGASVARYLNPSFDLMGHFFYGQSDASDNGRLGQPTWLNFKADMYNLNLLFKYKINNGYLLKEASFLAPYILGGIGGNLAKTSGSGYSGAFNESYLNPNIYGGLGLNVRISSTIGLHVQSSLMTPLNDKIDGWYPDIAQNKGPDLFLENSVGIVISLGRPVKKDADGDGVLDKFDKCPDTPAGVPVDANGCPLDNDKDGVLDYQDDCPTMAGPKEFNGCPDTDKDGIPDKIDECPEVFGLAAFSGCPDTDGDGVTDEADRCPNTPNGYKVDRFGCPVDNDRDGIPDSEDICPDKPGVAELKGCPFTIGYIVGKYNISMKPIYFDFDSFTLKPDGIDALERIANALHNHKDYGVQFDGHSDYIGTEKFNLDLSEKRANSAKWYLIKKGINDLQIRLQYFGETKPAFDNKTKEGRSLNRRVEYSLFELGKK
jgi:outer membrane protein OmpA-like peptidoglycan-associated protein